MTPSQRRRKRRRCVVPARVRDACTGEARCAAPSGTAHRSRVNPACPCPCPCRGSPRGAAPDAAQTVAPRGPPAAAPVGLRVGLVAPAPRAAAQGRAVPESEQRASPRAAVLAIAKAAVAPAGEAPHAAAPGAARQAAVRVREVGSAPHVAEGQGPRLTVPPSARGRAARARVPADEPGTALRERTSLAARQAGAPPALGESAQPVPRVAAPAIGAGRRPAVPPQPAQRAVPRVVRPAADRPGVHYRTGREIARPVRWRAAVMPD
jgi:ribonuclease E